jgi:hypothetical protein
MPVLLFQTPNICNHGVDFLFCELLLVRWHFAFAIHNRIKDPFVTNSILPLGITEITRVIQSAFRGFGAAVPSMTGGAVLGIQGRRISRVSACRAVWPHYGNSANYRNDEEHYKRVLNQPASRVTSENAFVGSCGINISESGNS